MHECVLNINLEVLHKRSSEFDSSLTIFYFAVNVVDFGIRYIDSVSISCVEVERDFIIGVGTIRPLR